MENTEKSFSCSTHVNKNTQMLSASQRIRRVKEKGAEGWLWRTGAFAGQFGDPYIQNTGTVALLSSYSRKKSWKVVWLVLL